jgi:hypothetical protein
MFRMGMATVARGPAVTRVLSGSSLTNQQKVGCKWPERPWLELLIFGWNFQPDLKLICHRIIGYNEQHKPISLTLNSMHPPQNQNVANCSIGILMVYKECPEYSSPKPLWKSYKKNSLETTQWGKFIKS